MSAGETEADLTNKLCAGWAAGHEVVGGPLQAGQMSTGGRATSKCIWHSNQGPGCLCRCYSNGKCQLQVACITAV